VLIEAKGKTLVRTTEVIHNADLTLTAFYSLAGRSDLADRVRPTARRRAGQPEEADTTPTEESPT
jgi:hypothetical protein